MKKLEPKAFKEFIDKELAKEVRWNDTLDDALFDSVLANTQNVLYTQGITVQDPSTVRINGDAYVMTVLYNPYAVMSVGAIVAACYYNAFNQMVVFVDDKFMALSANSQAFTLQHEIGHIQHKHYSIMGNRYLDEESAADNYACTQTSKSIGISTLLEIKSVLKGFKYWRSRKELTRRINCIK